MTHHPKLITLIVPCYNEAEALPLFYAETTKVISQIKDYNFEFLFVDDGSQDNTLEIIKSLADSDPRVKYITFSRNFGKESAMLAGLENSQGDLVAMMDADLQDPPSLLPEMVHFIEDGYDCVATRRVSRKGEPPIRSFFARRFYKLINRLSKTEMVDGARDYRLMTRQMVNSIIECREYNRYSKGLWSFVGYKTKWLEYENIERAAGKTHWSFWQLFKYAIDGIVAFSTVPLTLAAFLGIVFCLIAFIAIIVIICKTLIFGDPVNGWPSLACLILFVGGVQLFFIGILGEYLAKTYLETKNRPKYIVKESTAFTPIHDTSKSNHASSHQK